MGHDIPLSGGSRARLSATLVGVDLIAVVTAMAVAAMLEPAHGWAIVLTGAAAGAVHGCLAMALGLYDTSSMGRLRRGAVAMLCLSPLDAMMTLLGIAAVAGHPLAFRMAPIVVAAVSVVTMLRVGIAAWVDRRLDVLTERVVLVGRPATVSQLVAACRRSWMAERCVGVVAIGYAQEAPLTTLTTLDPQRDNSDALVEDFWRLADALRAQARRIDRVLIATAGLDEATLAATLERLEHLPFEIALVPPGAALAEAPDPLGRDNCPVLRRAAIDPGGRLCKRLLDIAAASVLLAIVTPVFLMLVVLIRRGSPGPALFRQTRWGWNNEPFTVFKFRTMWADAAAADGSLQATRGDKRITPLGCFLRSTSLDELPQLLNVLNGTMSLVGPRPHPVELNLRYLGIIARYAGRHRVLPGITGLAQVNGLRGETPTAASMQKRVELDLEYIRTRSLAADIWILLRTVGSVVRRVNAY